MAAKVIDGKAVAAEVRAALLHRDGSTVDAA